MAYILVPYPVSNASGTVVATVEEINNDNDH